MVHNQEFVAGDWRMVNMDRRKNRIPNNKLQVP